jgi:hypothetical protein
VQDDVPRAGADVPQARIVAGREADGVARRHVRLLAPERDGTRDEALVVHVVDRHTGGALGGCGERDREEGSVARRRVECMVSVQEEWRG